MNGVCVFPRLGLHFSGRLQSVEPSRQGCPKAVYFLFTSRWELLGNWNIPLVISGSLFMILVSKSKSQKDKLLGVCFEDVFTGIWPCPPALFENHYLVLVPKSKSQESKILGVCFVFVFTQIWKNHPSSLRTLAWYLAPRVNIKRKASLTKSSEILLLTYSPTPSSSVNLKEVKSYVRASNSSLLKSGNVLPSYLRTLAWYCQSPIFVSQEQLPRVFPYQCVPNNPRNMWSEIRYDALTYPDT